jgi:hypothetical protein
VEDGNDLLGTIGDDREAIQTPEAFFSDDFLVMDLAYEGFESCLTVIPISSFTFHYDKMVQNKQLYLGPMTRDDFSFLNLIGTQKLQQIRRQLAFTRAISCPDSGY